MFGRRYKPSEEVTPENYKRVFAKELLLGFMNGIAIGVLAFWLASGVAGVHGTLRGAVFFVVIVASAVYLAWEGIKEVVEWWTETIVGMNMEKERIEEHRKMVLEGLMGAGRVEPPLWLQHESILGFIYDFDRITVIYNGRSYKPVVDAEGRLRFVEKRRGEDEL